MKKNIWFITYDFFPYIWWIWVYCHNIYNQFMSKWIDNFIVFSPAKNELKNHVQILENYWYDTITKNYWASLALNLQIKKLIEQYDLWMIHINWGVWSFFLLQDLWIPLIYTVHQTYQQQYTYIPGHQWQRVMFYIEKYWYKSADLLIADCWDTKENLEKYYNAKWKVDVIPCWINLSDYTLSNETIKKKNVITYIWRLWTRKWILWLVESMKHIVKRNPEIILQIAWRWKLEHKLKEIIKRDNIESNINFLWFIDEEDKKRIIAESQLLIVPSIFEWFWIIVIEWMALKTVVLWTNSPGIRSLITHWKNWLLVDYWDTQWLVDMVLNWLEWTNSDSIITNWRNSVEAYYTWEKVANQLLDTYDQFI